MKEARTFAKFANALCILTGLVCLLCLAGILWPAHPGGYPSAKSAKLRAQIKNLAVGTIIYTADYDGILPSVFTQSEFEAALTPYTKNLSLFQPVKDFSTAPTFNYNLAGVDINSETSIKALGIKEPLNPYDVPMIYSLIIDKKEDSPAIIAYADTSVKLSAPKEPFTPATLFATQYERDLPPTKPK